MTALAKFALLGFLAIATYLSGIDAAYASSPMATVLCTIIEFIYGNLGRGLATLAIITVGVGAALGKTSWGLAITVGIGISIIFNAITITTDLTGIEACKAPLPPCDTWFCGTNSTGSTPGGSIPGGSTGSGKQHI